MYLYLPKINNLTINVDSYVVSTNGLESKYPIEALDRLIGTTIDRYTDGVLDTADAEIPAYLNSTKDGIVDSEGVSVPVGGTTGALSPDAAGTVAFNAVQDSPGNYKAFYSQGAVDGIRTYTYTLDVDASNSNADGFLYSDYNISMDGTPILQSYFGGNVFVDSGDYAMSTDYQLRCNRAITGKSATSLMYSEAQLDTAQIKASQKMAALRTEGYAGADVFVRSEWEAPRIDLLFNTPGSSEANVHIGGLGTVGFSTATFTAGNAPETISPKLWLKITINGVVGYLPWFSV